jgi:hypothetical protein
MVNIVDIVTIHDIIHILASFLDYKDFYKFIFYFYCNKKMDHKYIALIIRNQLLLKNKHAIISTLITHNCISFENLPQSILNKIVLDGSYKLILILHQYGISFGHLPQDILNQIILTHADIKTISVLTECGVSFKNLSQEILYQMILQTSNSTMVAYLEKNGILFKDFSQDQLNYFVLNCNPDILSMFCLLDILVGDLSQDVLNHIKMENNYKDILKYWSLKNMGYYK